MNREATPKKRTLKRAAKLLTKQVGKPLPAALKKIADRAIEPKLAVAFARPTTKRTQ